MQIDDDDIQTAVKWSKPWPLAVFIYGLFLCSTTLSGTWAVWVAHGTGTTSFVGPS